jgi:hypothetical protein
MSNMNDEDVLFVDSGAKFCPNDMAELSTILLKKNGERIASPMFHSFLCAKETQDYTYSLKFLRNLCPRLTKVRCWVLLDLCQAQINAWKEVFPNMKLFACNFHVTQAIRRWIKDSKRNMKCEFKDDDDLIEKALEDVQKLARDFDINFDEEVQKFYFTWTQHCKRFVKYMQKNYLNEDAKYPPSFWSVVRAKPLFQMDLTNNEAERFWKSYNDLNRDMHLCAKSWNNCVQILRELENRTMEKINWEERNTIIKINSKRNNSFTREKTLSKRKKSKMPILKKRRKIDKNDNSINVSSSSFDNRTESANGNGTNSHSENTDAVNSEELDISPASMQSTIPHLSESNITYTTFQKFLFQAISNVHANNSMPFMKENSQISNSQPSCSAVQGVSVQCQNAKENTQLQSQTTVKTSQFQSRSKKCIVFKQDKRYQPWL